MFKVGDIAKARLSHMVPYRVKLLEWLPTIQARYGTTTGILGCWKCEILRDRTEAHREVVGCNITVGEDDLTELDTNNSLNVPFPLRAGAIDSWEQDAIAWEGARAEGWLTSTREEYDREIKRGIVLHQNSFIQYPPLGSYVL